MKKWFFGIFMVLALLSSCELLGLLNGGESGFNMNPPDWVRGTWEAADGDLIVVSSDDIEHGTSGYMTAFSDSYDDVTDLTATEDLYTIEVSFVGQTSVWSFTNNHDGTMTTGESWGTEIYTKQ